MININQRKSIHLRQVDKMRKIEPLLNQIRFMTSIRSTWLITKCNV